MAHLAIMVRRADEHLSSTFLKANKVRWGAFLSTNRPTAINVGGFLSGRPISKEIGINTTDIIVNLFPESPECKKLFLHFT